MIDAAAMRIIESAMNPTLIELLATSPSASEALTDREYIEAAYREFVKQRSYAQFRQLATLKPERTLSAGELRALRRVGLETQGHTRLEAERTRKNSLHVWFALYRSALTINEVAELLGVSASRVRRRIKDRSLLVLENGGTKRVPSFQFEGSADVPGLGRVLPAISISVKPLEVLSWLVSPTSELEDSPGRPRSPREFLTETGDVEPVVAWTKALSSGGA